MQGGSEALPVHGTRTCVQARASVAVTAAQPALLLPLDEQMAAFQAKQDAA